MHRPERCLLPDSNLGGTQAFSSFRVQWQGVSVTSLTLWPVSCSPHLHTVHGRSTSSSPTSRCENTELFGRLAGVCTVKGDMSAACRAGHQSHSVLKTPTEQGEKPAHSFSDSPVSGDEPGLSEHESFFDDRAPSGSCGLSLPFSVRPESSMEDLPQTTMSHGRGCSDNPSGALFYASSTEVSTKVWPLSTDRFDVRDTCHKRTSESPPLVEQANQYHERFSAGTYSTEATDLNRCLHERLGSSAQWYMGQRPLGTTLDLSAHQCVGIEGHSFSSGLLPTSPGRSSRPSEDGQCGSSIIREQTGGTDIPSTLQGGRRRYFHLLGVNS